MDFATGFATGWAMGKKMFEGGNGWDIYTVNYGEGLIVTTIDSRIAETPKTTDYSFSFGTKEFKKATRIISGNKKITHIFTKRIVTSVINDKSEIIWTLTPDSNGKITSIYDVNGNEILNGVTAGNSVITNTPEGVALGYALAYNKEQEDETEELIEAYKQGTDDQKEIDDDTAEVDIIDFEGGSCVVYSAIDGQNKCTRYYGSYAVINSNGSVYVHDIFRSDFMYSNGNVISTNYYDVPMPVISLSGYSDYMGTVYDDNGNLI